jgi:putative intracellular protease/amidase
MNLTVLLFDNFETLDVFGPVEIFGRLKDKYQVFFCSLNGGLVKNEHGISIATERIDDLKNAVDIFLIPGGYGTRSAVNNAELVEKIIAICQQSKYVLTVCTGSALLAKTGLLNGRNATSNKRAFDWVVTQGPHVNWVKKARWTKEDKFYTSAGVSAGMDMALGFLSDMHGIDFARKVAFEIEYNWIEDMEEDDFYLQ